MWNEMEGRQKYLLYTAKQISDYRSRYITFIAKYRKAYRDWFQSLPGWEWVRLPMMDERTAEAVIGLLCILYIDDEINLTVDKTVTMVMRNPISDEEYNEWTSKIFKSPKTGNK